MRFPFVLGLILAAAAATPASAAPACRIDKAAYVLRGRPDLTLRFRPRGGALDLELRSARTRRSYWLALNQGNGRDPVSVIAISDPAGSSTPKEWPGLGPHDTLPGNVVDLTAYFLHADLGVIAGMPQPGDAAPELVFIPELGTALWYSGALFSEEPLPAAVREDVPRAFFRRMRCG